MTRFIAILLLLVTAGCVAYPYGTPYGGYGYPYGAAPYGGYPAQQQGYYPQQYRGYAPAATDYNPVSGSRTGSD